MFSGVSDVKVGNESGKDHINSMIQSFLHDKAVQKLVPERDAEIARMSKLIENLK